MWMGGGAHWGGMHHSVDWIETTSASVDLADSIYTTSASIASIGTSLLSIETTCFHRFHRHLFLAAGPGFFSGPCWHPVWTPWGRRWRWV